MRSGGKRCSRRFFWGVAVLAPLVAVAASTAREELREAMRARPNLERGEALFATCAGCHGPSGGGRYEDFVPRIAGQHREVIIQQLVDFRYAQRWDVRMEAFAEEHHLPDAQAIADVAAYTNALPSQQLTEVGSGELVEHGKAVYGRQCRSCHGRAAEGNASRRIPQLGGQHYGYLLNQMYDAAEGRRPNFPSEHMRLFTKMDRDDFYGLADYLSRLSLSSPAGPPLR